MTRFQIVAHHLAEIGAALRHCRTLPGYFLRMTMRYHGREAVVRLFAATGSAQP